MSNKTQKVNDAKTASARKFFPVLVGVTFLGLIIGFAALVGNRQPKVVVEGRTVIVDIADTAAERQQGLSGRTKLSQNHGMLFKLGSDQNGCMWMKEMNLTIDILWFDASRKLIEKQENVSPDTYPKTFCPTEKPSYVLEVPAGFALEIGANTHTTYLDL